MGNLGARALRAAGRAVMVAALVAFAASPALAATRTHDVAFAAAADGSAAFAGEEFSVWKVVDEDGGTVPAFAGVQNDGDEAAWAAALAGAATGIEPDAEFTTGADGTARLALGKGAYLVVGSPATAGDVTYRAVPYVMDLTDRALADNLTSYVKYTSDGPAPAAPEGNGETAPAVAAGLAKSGDAAAAAALCAAAAAAAAGAAAARKRARREGKEGLR